MVHTHTGTLHLRCQIEPEWGLHAKETKWPTEQMASSHTLLFVHANDQTPMPISRPLIRIEIRSPCRALNSDAVTPLIQFFMLC